MSAQVGSQNTTLQGGKSWLRSRMIGLKAFKPCQETTPTDFSLEKLDKVRFTA